MLRSAKSGDVSKIRISVQYRAKRGRVYELTRGSDVLALHICPPEEVPDSGGWHVEARLGAGAGPPMADGWGTTATAALNATASAWASRTPLLTAFDWDAVVRELQGVHAV